MNKKDDTFWINNSEHLLQILLDKYSEQLDIETVEAVQHYIDHNEYEMAYEGLFIELMNLDQKPKNIDFDMYTDLGKGLKIDVESVFDSDFWKKYIQYSSS
ncbi:MAG: hypothetical protein L3J00_00270 [Thiomicrorhabdus sp.]|nr:hypothetical protein [Thiomicrorhabdus sp.]